MAKVMVLVFGDDAVLSPVIDEAVAGANSVRFTEVEVRRAPLRAASALADMDGVLFVVDSDASVADLRSLLHDAAHERTLDDLVFGVVGAAASAQALATSGGILVTEAGQGSATERARGLSRRVARLSGWVRHGLGHEAEHGRQAHQHPHDHSAT